MSSNIKEDTSAYIGILSMDGAYSFDILMYRFEGSEEELVQRHTVSNANVATNFIKEFTVTNLDDIGKHVRFVVLDTTMYMPTMKPLALFAWANGSDQPHMIRFANNLSSNFMMKRIAFDVERFKSCVFEYDFGFMKLQNLH